MTPVIIGNATLYNCDCMDYMRGLPDKAFDLAIVMVYFGVSTAEYKSCVHQKNCKSARLVNT